MMSFWIRHVRSIGLGPVTLCRDFIVLLLAFVPGTLCAQQVEVKWAYTVEGGTNPWDDYWHGAGNIATDPWGNVAIVSFGGHDLTMNTSGPALNIPHTGGGAGDGFLGRYRADGTPVWGFWLGSTEWDAATGVAMDNEGNVYLNFTFEGPFDMDPGPDTAMIAPADGDRDVAILKYDSTGHFLNAIHLVAAYNDPTAGQIERMGFDAENNLYVAGFFSQRMDLDPDTSELIVTGNGVFDCAYVAKYSPDGHLLQHIVLPSVQLESDVMDLVVDPDGAFFIVGIFSYGLDLDDGPASLLISGPNDAAFVARYDRDFHPIWGRSLAETGISHYAFVACRGLNGGLIMSGNFRGDIQVPLSDGTVLSMNGGFDELTDYIAALTADGQFLWFRKFVTGQWNSLKRLSARDDGTFYVAVWCGAEVDLDPGVSDFTITNSGSSGSDMGIARYSMATCDFLLGHGFTGGGNLNYNDLEVRGSSLYMSGTYTTSLHPDIPASSTVITPGGLAVIKYCLVPDRITFSATGDPLVLCPGADSLVIARGADRFEWYDSLNGGTLIGTGDTLEFHDVEEAGIVFVEGINGTCISPRVPLHVVVRPQVELSVDSLTICDGDTVRLSYTGFGDVFGSDAPEAFTSGYVPHGDLPLWVTATDLAGGCVVSDTAFIHVLQAPEVSLVLAPDSMCLFDPAVLLGGADPPGGTWTGEGVVGGSQWSPAESGAGVFSVAYTVADGNGCAATAVDTMTVMPCFTGIAEDPNTNGSIVFFPNPATDRIQVNSTKEIDGIFILLDAQGRRVIGPRQVRSSQPIELHALVPGPYVACFITEQGTVRSKLVVGQP